MLPAGALPGGAAIETRSLPRPGNGVTECVHLGLNEPPEGGSLPLQDASCSAADLAGSCTCCGKSRPCIVRSADALGPDTNPCSVSTKLAETAAHRRLKASLPGRTRGMHACARAMVPWGLTKRSPGWARRVPAQHGTALNRNCCVSEVYRILPRRLQIEELRQVISVPGGVSELRP